MRRRQFIELAGDAAARTFAMVPDILLVDKPFGALDS